MNIKAPRPQTKQYKIELKSKSTPEEIIKRELKNKKASEKYHAIPFITCEDCGKKMRDTKQTRKVHPKTRFHRWYSKKNINNNDE